MKRRKKQKKADTEFLTDIEDPEQSDQEFRTLETEAMKEDGLDEYEAARDVAYGVGYFTGHTRTK